MSSREPSVAIAALRAAGFVLATALVSGGVLAGCNLVGSSGLQTDYSFDALSYASPEYGPSTGVLPEVPCAIGGEPTPHWRAT